MAVYVVRHARAGTRPATDRPDEERPLTAGGWRQAVQIADTLEHVGIKRILTSRYTRCVETVEPLAARIGVPPEVHPALAEEASLRQTWELLEELVGEDVVVCSHGNVIGAVLDRVRRRGAEIASPHWTCPKGSVWRLEPDDDLLFGRAVLELQPD